ncbi:hypothetical protein Bbelb_265690 [Branchiostoma belcheri]|nr:hypothetical protein Bbelb_265690 [Branchiostoma belcheri]
MTLSIEDYCLDRTREDWTRSGDLETRARWQQQHPQSFEIQHVTLEDYCLDLTREDWTRSGDLETQEQDDNNKIHRLDETADFEVEDRVKSSYGDFCFSVFKMRTRRLDCSRRKNQTFEDRAA